MAFFRPDKLIFPTALLVIHTYTRGEYILRIEISALCRLYVFLAALIIVIVRMRILPLACSRVFEKKITKFYYFRPGIQSDKSLSSIHAFAR